MSEQELPQANPQLAHTPAAPAQPIAAEVNLTVQAPAVAGVQPPVPPVQAAAPPAVAGVQPPVPPVQAAAPPAVAGVQPPAPPVQAAAPPVAARPFGAVHGHAPAPGVRVRLMHRRNILRRYRYTEGQKARALALLDQGLSCRRVARLISGHCSPGTVCRWRQIRNARAILQNQRNAFGGR